MKRTVFVFMALLIGIVLPLQTVQSRVDPETTLWNGDAGEDHPWGGDITDPGGLHIKPGHDNGYIGMSIIGRIVGYSVPIILRFYGKRHGSLAPRVPIISNLTPANPTPLRTISVGGGN